MARLVGMILLSVVFIMSMSWALSAVQASDTTTLYKPVAHIVLNGDRIDKLTKTEPPVPLAECLGVLDADKALLLGVIAQHGAPLVSAALSVALPEGFILEMACEAVGQRGANRGIR